MIDKANSSRCQLKSVKTSLITFISDLLPLFQGKNVFFEADLI